MTEGNTVPLAKWGVGVATRFVAVSHDDTRAVSATRDNHLRVWDISTGTLALGPLIGHTNTVHSVAYSPDGTRIVSGSYDRTIRIWDTNTGAPIGKPLLGHTSAVISVAVSSDSSRIVSGSLDMTIRLWDARTGSPMCKPLKGHTEKIISVAFSPDNTLIGSGSHDCTVRLWDVRTGASIGKPLQGHRFAVTSVAFSPDGTLIASGSSDMTIRVWDILTGNPVGEPLYGHTFIVNSVAFFPDNTHVVSGSADRTIRIWDLRTSATIGEPLRGYTSSVETVVVLPESMRIISGSLDGTICVWEAPRCVLPPDMIAPSNTPSFDMVTSRMSTQEMFECLVKHGCKDLTMFIDAEQGSTSVIASGGFGDVRRLMLSDGTSAAVKTLRLRILLKDDDKGAKRAVREVYIWSRLHHPNVQELLGIAVFRGELGMISPWMKQGNLQQYIAAHPDIERYPLCVQVALGVSYLHETNMVHGDIKATNVLVSDDGILKINDFDHAILSDTTLQFTTTTRPGGGTLRWMAPELFEAEEEEEEEEEEENGGSKPQVARTKQTDIYAFGMTVLEIYTGRVPFAEYRTDAGVCKAIILKKFPRRPSELSGSDNQTRRLWQLLEKCWDYNPAARMNAPSVLKHMSLTRV